MTEGEFLGKVAELTAKVTWLEAYRQKWVLIRFYCEETLSIQGEQKRWDRGAHDQLVSMIAAARRKVEVIDVALLVEREALEAAMQEVDPDAQSYS